jgi:hypothetical protein
VVIVYSQAMLRGLAIALCSAACLRDPKFKGVVQDAPESDAPDGSMTACADGVNAIKPGAMGASAEACGPGYLLRFSNQGAKLPFQFVVGGAQLLQNGRTCNDERLAGLAIFPVQLVNGQPSTGVAGDDPVIEMAGPVVAKISVNWSADYSCASSATLEDSTTYTFFPDGHIVRWDHLRQGTAITNTSCMACAGGGSGPGFRLTSFMTLGADSNADLTGTPISGLVSYGAEATGLSDTCITTLGQRVAFGWRNALGRIRVAESTANPNQRVLAFVQDIVDDTMIPATFADEVTTHIVVASTGACSDLRTRARAHAARPGLSIQHAGSTTARRRARSPCRRA